MKEDSCKMKKLIISALSACLLILSVFVLGSCAQKIPTPQNVRIVEDTQSITWNRVAKAKSYVITISGDDRERTISQNTFSLEYLEPGSYVISIKAVSKDMDFADSDWVSIPYDRPEESGLRYKAINNNTEYELIGAGSASGDIVMEDEYRGKPVTSIAAKAFSGNSRITSIKVGKYVKTIGKNAFTRCSSLTSVTFDEECVITEIGEYAFQSCKKLESITIPDTVKLIPSYMFSWCSALKSITLGNETEAISSYSFSNCEALTELVIPNTVKVIGEYAFSDCLALKNVTFGSSLEEIHTYSFFNCGALEKVEFGNSLKLIESYSFGNCISLKSLTIPDSCTTIGAEAFRSCKALATVKLGKGLVKIGTSAFSDTAFYEAADELIVVDGWVIESKNKEITEISLPEGVYGIASAAFAYCRKLENIQLSGIKYVNSYAFTYCDSIQNVRFDDSLLDIGDFAFYYCSLLRNVAFGNSLESIGNSAFSSCARLDNKSTSIKLPASLTHIGSSAFKNTAAFNANMGIIYIDTWAVDCNMPSGMGTTNIIIEPGTLGIADYCADNVIVMFSIEIPDSVKYIGKSAFYKSSMVQTISLPRDLKVIGDYAFYGCSSAWFGDNGQTVIPNGTEYIGRSAFYECMAMTGVNIPDSVKEIGAFAFYKCINLGESQFFLDEEKTKPIIGTVTIGSNVSVIGERAFYGCEAITDIVLPNSLTQLGTRAFYKCTKLKNVTLGTSLTEIPDYAFYNCSALEAISIPDGVTRIGRYAFKGCSSITELNLGKNVDTVDEYAFYACTGIKSIVLTDSTKTIGNFAFRGCSSTASIIIPEGVSTIGKHAFYGATSATVFCEADKIGAYWNQRWNTSYLPVIWGVTLSDDRSYVVSFTYDASKLSYISENELMTTPVRNNYVFAGFSINADGSTKDYTVTTLSEATEGTVLYLVWNEQTEEEPDNSGTSEPSDENPSDESTEATE